MKRIFLLMAFWMAVVPGTGLAQGIAASSVTTAGGTSNAAAAADMSVKGVNYAHFQLRTADNVCLPYIDLNTQPAQELAYRVNITKQDNLYAVLDIAQNDMAPLLETKILAISGADVFFANTRSKDATDLIYFCTAGSGNYLNGLEIIGQQDGKFKNLFKMKDVPEEARIRLGGCSMKLIPDKNDRMSILLFGNNTPVYIIQWNGEQYTGHFVSRNY
jgi:hypothetical protein